MTSILTRARHTLEMIKFSHSIFALPFALSSLFFAAQGIPPIKTLLLIILAMVLARNTAMAFNRIVDANIDAQNPRTANRHIPQGLLSRRYVMTFVLINATLFILVTAFFNSLSFALSPVALFLICIYSLTKRWTHLSHISLGLALGLSPVGAWIALTGRIDLLPLILGTSVMFWVAGFDILYALQDAEFDQGMGLKSLVVKYGKSRAIGLSRIFHVICLILLALLGTLYHLETIYFISVTVIGFSFILEHRFVSPNDLSRLNVAFFNVNGFVGVIFLVGVILETLCLH